MPVNKASKEVAAAFQAVAKEIGGAYVFASRDHSILRSDAAHKLLAGFDYAKHKCGACSTEFAALDGSSPYCITCGAEDVVKGEAIAKQDMHIHEDKHLTSLACSGCKSINVMHQASRTAGKDGMFCVTCGTEMISQIVVADDDLAPVDEVDIDDMEVMDTDPDMTMAGEGNTDDPGLDAPGASPEQRQAAPKPPEGGQEPDITKTAPDCKVDDQSERKVQTGGDEKCDDKQSASPEDEMDTDLDLDLEESDTLDALPQDGDSSNDLNTVQDTVADADEMPPADDGDMEQVEMMDMVDDENLEDVAVIAKSNVLYLNKGPYLVAELKQEKAGKNQDIFETQGFQDAIVASLGKNGLRKTADMFGFTKIRVKANIKAIVAKKVQAEVASQTESMKKFSKSLSASMKQSLDIAATGLNKNFFKGKKHPLKEAIISELARLNVRKPEKLVDRVFEQAGLDYNAALLLQAEEVLAKSPEMRAEISNLLDITGLIATRRTTANAEVAEGEDYEEDDGDEDDESFAMASVRPVSETKIRKTSQASTSGKKSVRDILGGSTLSFN